MELINTIVTFLIYFSVAFIAGALVGTLGVVVWVTCEIRKDRKKVHYGNAD